MPSIGVLEHNQKPTDKPTRRIKRSGGQSLVRQCMAYWVIENVLLQMLEKPVRVRESIAPRPYVLYQADEHCQSPRSGNLRWEPPKTRRCLKGHPWGNVFVDTEAHIASLNSSGADLR